MYLRDCKVAYDDYLDDMDPSLMRRYRHRFIDPDMFIDEEEFKEDNYVEDMDMPEVW
jgi:hypothetical protein